MSTRVPFDVPGGDLRGAVSVFDGRAVTRIPYTRVADDVARARDRLARAGVERGMCVGILGENCYAWMIHDLAALALGAVPVCFPIDEFASKPADELAGAYDLSLLLVTRRVGNRERVPWVGVIDAPDAMAATVRVAADGGLRARIRGTDVCGVIFSSGTTGGLKALLVSRAGVEDTVEALAGDWEVGRGDGLLVALPLSIFQQRLLIYAALRRDADILLTEPNLLVRSFKALRPTLVLAPPALFETIERRYHALPRADRAARTLASRALGLIPWRGLRARLRRRLFRFAHDALGGRIRVLITGSAPSRRSTLAFYELAGIPLFQAYGLAEVGFIAWNRPGRNRTMSVGHPIVPGSVSLADDGEILLSLPHPQAIGYFGVEPAEQARTFLPDGRIATGDLGRIDRDGYLHITGRKKNIILTQGGEKLHPEPLELVLASTPGVDRAVVVGGGDLPGLVAVVAIDPGASADAEARIRAELEAAVDGLNDRVRAVSRITRTIVTRVAFRPESGLVTRNLKVDRGAVVRYFARELAP